MTFNSEQWRRYQNALKGYAGEKRFAKIITDHLSSSHLALYGLAHENKASWYQLDCLLIFLHKILVIEIKNYKGEFALKGDCLYSYTTEEEYNNPLHQLKRSKIYLQKIIPRLGLDLLTESAVVFVNQEFTLFHAEREPLIILPTQINSFIQKLNQEQGNVGVYQQNLARKLSAWHRTDCPYNKMPTYDYANLRKGVLCRDCRGRMDANFTSFVCRHCSYIESIDAAVLRQVVEYNFLFPNQRITTGVMFEWICGAISRVTLQRVLASHLRKSGNGRSVHYILN
jgi:hypothetical protein